MKNKTVYILGAGFSIEAGAPSQAQIIGKIFEFAKENESEEKDEKERKEIREKIKEFKSFLVDTMGIAEEFHNTIALEDIFTPIDHCIVNNTAFRGVSVEKLAAKRVLIFELISLILNDSLKNTNKEYIDKFAKYVVDICKQRHIDKNNIDPISIISTNWDILLDNSLYNEIKKESTKDKPGVVDYCCYVSSYDKGDETVKPGLQILGRGGFNTKILKLHGSMNWLQCRRCQRLYVTFNKDTVMSSYHNDEVTCRHCNANFGKKLSHKLSANLVMPTFMKDLSNPQYKIIWQNAGIELSEAKKIVFIGYSLPQADFEMRQLLSRMVDVETEIEVVGFKDENKPYEYDNVIKNYQQFFGRKVTDFEKGASKYIDSLETKYCKKETIIFLGDSITAGEDLADKSVWTSIIENNSANLNLINKGIGGDTTSGMLARFHNDVFGNQPDYVHVMGGINDLLVGADVNQIKSNIQAICQQAKHHKINPIIGISPLPVIDMINSDLKEYANVQHVIEELQKLSEWIVKYSHNYSNITVIDYNKEIASEYKDNLADLYLDGIHLNDEGNQLLAKIFMEKFKGEI